LVTTADVPVTSRVPNLTLERLKFAARVTRDMVLIAPTKVEMMTETFEHDFAEPGLLFKAQRSFRYQPHLQKFKSFLQDLKLTDHRDLSITGFTNQ